MRSARRRDSSIIWPGFVDAVTTLLMALDSDETLAQRAALAEEGALLSPEKAVGMSVGVAKQPQTPTEAADEGKDELDNLIDELDDLDL